MPEVCTREVSFEWVRECLSRLNGTLSEARDPVHVRVRVHCEAMPVEGHTRRWQLILHLHYDPISSTHLLEENI